MREVLPFCWVWVLELGKSLGAVARHGQMDLLAHIVPVELDTNVVCALSVFCEVVLLPDGIDKILGMVLSNIIHAKVVDH